MKNFATCVLVIEPHPLMRDSLCAAIAAEADFKVMLPSDGDEPAGCFVLPGQDDLLFLSAKPDIILFSLGNPGLQDLQALDDLHRLWAGTPVLALTRNEEPGQELAALAHGAQAVLTKSVSRDALLGALRAIKQQFI